MNIEITVKELNGRHIPAVTSQQVAEIFGKQHAHVLRDIAQILTQVPENFVESNFGSYEVEYDTGLGLKKAPVYILSKDGFILLTMGYTGEKAMKFKVDYIARFNEMERQLAGRGGMLPQSYADALRALAAEVEMREAVEAQKALAEAQRDEAIRTKSQIGGKREATAMATASAAVRQRDALADRLGEGKTYKQVKAIPWLTVIFRESAGMYSQVGRKLAELGKRMGLPPRLIEDSRYGTLKAHHVDVIEAFRLELRKDRNMLARYRWERAV